MLRSRRNGISAPSGNSPAFPFTPVGLVANARLLSAGVLLATSLSLSSQSANPWRRVPNNTLRMPSSVADPAVPLP